VRKLKAFLIFEATILAFVIFLSAVLVAGQELYSSKWDKGVVVVLYGSQYGTGWWVSENYVVTAGHVVNYQANGKVTLIHGDYQSIGYVIYANSLTDIAIIKAEKKPSNQYIFPLAMKDPDKGIQIFVIGYPYELYKIIGDIGVMSSNPRISEGIIAWTYPEKHLFEFQATTDQGNSGGPIVDYAGNVVGLVSFAITGSVANMYYGTSVSAIKDALSKCGVSYKVGLSSSIRVSESMQPYLTALILGAGAAAVTTAVLVPMYMKGKRRAAGKATLALIGIMLVGAATVIQMIVDWYQSYAYGIPMPNTIKFLVIVAGVLSLLAVIISLKSSKVKPYA